MIENIGEHTVKIVEGVSVEWYCRGRFDRPDGPAIEYADGTKLWYQYGKLNRIDGPAIEYADGSKLWYRNGKLYDVADSTTI
jgi:hypothetical protein